MIDISIEKNLIYYENFFQDVKKCWFDENFLLNWNFQLIFVSVIKVLPQKTWRYDNIQDKIFYFFSFPFFSFSLTLQFDFSFCCFL